MIGSCIYCGETKREKDNKSCYSCGSVDFKDTTIKIPKAIGTACKSFKAMRQRTFFDDVNDLNRALSEFDPLGFFINTVKLYINTAKRILGVKIYI